jgi:murein DD-endopeptidase MepM/ murein hydrolase activator NlpD
MLPNLVSAGSFPAPTGAFGLPFNENQTGSSCATAGFSRHQYHMEFNSGTDPVTGKLINKFHIGEDWNGKCGGNTDKGYPLLAISNGEIFRIEGLDSIPSQGNRVYTRHTFPYSGNTSGVMVVESAMLHLDSIATGVVVGKKVSVGDVIAYLGNTGTGSAHLHWEMRRNLHSSTPSFANPYVFPLEITKALDYLPPSLVVDDRRKVDFLLVNNYSWKYFSSSGNAPSSTMYVTKNGELRNLKQAMELGWITSRDIQFKKEGLWYYYKTESIGSLFFEKGKEYRVRSTLSGVTFGLPVPGNRFQSDRARLDMINAVKNDSRFVSFDTSTYQIVDGWDPDWELHKMVFILASGKQTWVAQITNKANPLSRQTAFIDPDTGKWTGFVVISKNVLY